MSEQAVGQYACPNGHPVRASARFCPACGTAIEHPVDETTMRDAHWQPPGSSWPADVQWPPAVPVPAAPAPAPATAGRSSWTWIALVAGLVVLAAGGGLLGVHVSRADTRPTATATSATPTFSPTPTPTGSRGTTPTPVPAPPTPTPTPPNPDTTMMGVVDVTAVRGESHAQSVGYTLNEYFSGINQKDMPRVLAVMDPTGVVNRDNPRQVEQFRVNISTTTDSNVVVHWIRPDTATGGVLVGVTFTSRQEARFGPANLTCANWSLTYVLSGQFLIVRTTGTYEAC